jgi:hypothetical protein
VNKFKLTFCLLLSIFLFVNVYAGDLPKVNVVSVKRVFHNGEHNAFTDMCRFNGKIYLTFRSCPDGHSVYPSASIIVLSSKDGKKWEKVFQFNVADRDTRDPHFVVFKNKLFVYTGTWHCEKDDPGGKFRDTNQHLGYCVWSSDGKKWTEPQMVEGTYGHYIWRAAVYKDKVYLCGRRKHQFIEMPRNDESRRITESAMLVSNNGINFTKAALFQKYNGDETAFLFEKDGAVVAVARRGRGLAEICRSNPPYVEWERKELSRYIGGPLLEKWDGRYFIGGRKMINEGPRSTVFYWLGENDKLIECVNLPSSGDTSYPGFVKLSKNSALVSYYSSHEKDENGNEITAIYLAILELEK